jgi:hypothetical protein
MCRDNSIHGATVTPGIAELVRFALVDCRLAFRMQNLDQKLKRFAQEQSRPAPLADDAK